MPQNIINRVTKVPLYEDQWSYNDYSTPPSVTYSRKLIGNVDSSYQNRRFSGTRTPNYRQFRSLNGYLPTLAASDSWDWHQAHPTVRRSYDSKGRITRMRIDESVEGFTVPAFPASAPLVAEAWSKVRRKVLDQDFNSRVFLAEGSKTIDMIADRATSLAKAYSSFRKGKLKDAAQHLGLTPKTAHSTWLEYKYGWMPVLMDIHGAAKTIAELNFKRDQSTFRAASSQSVPLLPVNGGGAVGVAVTSCKAWVTVRVHNRNVTTLNRLGLLNPLLVTWELVPFSFVADWFVNIGDCIAEASAFAGVTILTGGSSVLESFDGNFVGGNPAPFRERRVMSVKYRRYNRSPGVETMPRLRVKSNPLSLAKLVTSGALLRTLVGSSGSPPHMDRRPPRRIKGIIPESHWNF